MLSRPGAGKSRVQLISVRGSLGLVPVVVATAGLCATVFSWHHSSAALAQSSGQYDAYFVTAPSCPQCQAMLPHIVRTPEVRVLDWSTESSRTAYQRLRTEHGLERLDKPIVLPLLATLGPGGWYREWTGPRDISTALSLIGRWNGTPFPHAQLATVVLGFALGIGFGPAVLAWSRPLLGVAAALAAIKLSLACSDCDVGGTVALTGAAIAACAVGALAVAGRTRLVVLPILVAGLLSGQFYFLIGDPRLCWPCTGFLLVASLLGGASPAAVRDITPYQHALAGLLPVCVLMVASLAVWGSHAIASFRVTTQGPQHLGAGTLACGAMPGQSSLVGLPSSRFVRSVEGDDPALASRILVVGKPGCPPCKEAYRALTAAFPTRVEFVRPAGDTNPYLRLFPRPVDTASSPLRYTVPIAIVPTIVLTDREGVIVREHLSWPPTSADAQSIVRQVEVVLGTGGQL